MEKNTQNLGSSQENNEKVETIEKDVPSSRFQRDQRVVNTASADDTSAPVTSFDKVKVKSKGAVLKQEVASNVVTKGLGGDISADGTGAYTLSYSGNEGTVLGSAAYTPMVGQSRSESRYGKKLDATAKKIDYVASEQVIEDFDESKPLSQSESGVQGYNGTYRNANARAQKVSGNVPGELMFQRSVDELKRDQLYFSTGQVVNTGNVDTQDTPTKIPTLNANGIYSYNNGDNDYSLSRGNYHNRALRIKVDATGKISQFKFDTVNLSTDNVEQGIADQSSSHAMIDRNYAEMDRQIMDAKAGDEKADIWTPLARAVAEPTKTVGYLRDIENITGAEVFLADKKTSACHSYQLNRAAKDGMKTYTPMVEAVMGLIMPELDSSVAAGIDNVFKKDYYVKGSAALMINLFDSTSKYAKKSDILLQPRSFKMHLSTADNNMKPLRVKSELVQNVNAHEVFSTIDRDYDPLMPVCISDKAALIHCYDFNDLYSFSELDDNGTPKFTKAPFSYMYSDIRNNYVVTSACPLLSGIHKFLNSVGYKLRELIGSDELVIPMIHSTCFFSLWSLIVLAATPFILNERVNSLRDVIYYEKNVEYPFHQLITIQDANPTDNVNFENSSIMEPLKSKIMQPSVALSWYMPELFWPFDEETLDDKYKYVLPWYFNEQNFTFTDTTAYIDSDKACMSMPSIRSGARFSFLDNIYSMDERDIRLCLDRLTQLPTNETGTGEQGVYKYSQMSDGIPFLTFSKTNFNMKTFLSLCRELGCFIVAPHGYISVSPLATELATFANETDGIFGNTSYILKYWHGKNAIVDEGSGTQSILLNSQINVNRASAYVQDWNAIPAVNFSGESVNDHGWLPALSMLFTSGSYTPAFGKGRFVPFTTGVSDNAGGQKVYNDGKDSDVYSVLSLQKAFWTRIQKLPFAISPFDTCSNLRRAGEDGIKIDPFDLLYCFGLAGFRASDYQEDVYNRLNQVVNQGFTFIKDPFVSASPIFKDAEKYTQSSNSASLQQ